MRYVAGFLMTNRLVYLVRKTHPKALAGMLNGIGGKIEPGESPTAAMEREFREETGAEVTGWKPFCILEGNYALDGGDAEFFEVHFFWKRDEGAKLPLTVNDAGEDMNWYRVHNLIRQPVRYSLQPNCLWLIPMAQNLAVGQERAKWFVVSERY